MILLDKICRDFVVGDEAVHALNRVDLDITEGDYISVMGTSGSGKSTLLNILGLLDAPDSGHYRFQGKELTTLNEEAGARFRRDNIGFIFQSFHLIPRLTALENVAMPMMLMGVPPGDRKQRAVDILVQLGLEDRAHHRPDQLSGGQQQRVAIARAAVLSPTLLLADEPTGNLDTASGEEVMKVLEKLNGGGMTLIMVTHDSRLGKRANRRLFMEDGRITRDQ